MSLEAELTIRSHTEEDIPLIMDSWGSSYFQGNDMNKIMSPQDFHQFHRPLRQRIITRSSNRIDVFCSKEDPWHVLGWISYDNSIDPLIIHYVYIKQAFQKEGLATYLLQKIVPDRRSTVMTHLTYNASKIIAKKPEFFQRFKYVPHLV